MIQLISLVLFAEIWNTVGQVLFKQGTNRLSSADLRSLSGYRVYVSKVLHLKEIWLGIVAMAAGLIVWLMALNLGDLSLVFPIGSLQYLLVLGASILFLGEKPDKCKVIGTVLVSVGIIVIARS